MQFSEADWQAILLTIKLAATTTTLLLLLGTPLAWWLARTQNRVAAVIGALVALPLVLPPTVIGFYLLLAFAPDGIIGAITQPLGLGTLAFTFWGLVIASMLYSLPFVVQPLQNSFAELGERPLEVAATLGAGPLDRFFHVVVPMCRSGFLSAAILGFAHTVGEFGVVLMIGGNIPEETRVVSIQIYDHVEALEYSQANSLSLIMIGFSFIVLLSLFMIQQRRKLRHKGLMW
ncbi:MAG: molybdate ABC transporter permease subunit [Aestuariibacter sp.]